MLLNIPKRAKRELPWFIPRKATYGRVKGRALKYYQGELGKWIMKVRKRK